MNKKEKNQYMKEYNQRPEVKKRRKKYMKEYGKKYNQRPEIRERERKYRREYSQRPHVKKRIRKYYIEHKKHIQEYRQRPEIRERIKKYEQKQKVKERRREMSRKNLQRPEVRERIKKWRKKWRLIPKEKRTKMSKEAKKHLRRMRLKDKNPMWKGDEVKSPALHSWIKRNKNKPKLCKRCKKEKPFDLANISGKYKRDINDFEWLCRRCHMEKDGRLKKLAKFQKTKYQLNKKEGGYEKTALADALV